jgi:hypothetical protein
MGAPRLSVRRSWFLTPAARARIPTLAEADGAVVRDAATGAVVRVRVCAHARTASVQSAEGASAIATIAPADAPPHLRTKRGSQALAPAASPSDAHFDPTAHARRGAPAAAEREADLEHDQAAAQERAQEPQREWAHAQAQERAQEHAQEPQRDRAREEQPCAQEQEHTRQVQPCAPEQPAAREAEAREAREAEAREAEAREAREAEAREAEALAALRARLTALDRACPELFIGAAVADAAWALVPCAERERLGDACLAILNAAVRTDARARAAYRTLAALTVGAASPASAEAHPPAAQRP